MSSWYRDSSTWFEASDAQAWIPSTTSSQTNYNHSQVPDVKTLKTPKTNMSQRMSKEVKTQPPAIVPSLQDKFFELPSHSVSDSQNAWNAYVLSTNTSNDDFLTDWDSPSPTTTKGNEVQAIPTKPETVVFSKLKRNVDIEEELTKQNRFKTEMCQSWMATGACRYGGKCQFAHGKDELNPVIRHPKYKTEICKTFSTTGQCPYGKRCRFVHQLRELRMDDPTEEEEMAQIQLKLQEISLSLAPDPVFPSSGHPIPTPASTTTTNIKKGSRLPFLQKLRNQL